ncbi:AraC family transcriptional regulator [Flavobacterium algicola]|uniref:AraC family transcriptional regulator n=1 Tax=Flavobacterium algicola TaxID=556529 RepID=UPI001EFD5EB1|nr:AraC family transcriptional regulator [Flavobacterium algicola]MCG9793713.1 AraC family transcriptional regulator [Flavobacterium algicola]
MKLTYKQTESKPENSFSVKHDKKPCLDHDWHFHKEIELIYFIKSSGTRYIGNSIGTFNAGDLYMIGSNVPHLFKNDKVNPLSPVEAETVDMIVVKFDPEFLGKQFLNLSESRALQLLLENAEKGLKFSKAISKVVHQIMVELTQNNGLKNIIGLLNVLEVLSSTDDFHSLCSEVVVSSYTNKEKERMARIISFLTENFDKKIELEEVASVAYMTPNAFCRYFKKRTRKSFTQYLNEIRLRNACKLLIEGEMQVATVCYLSGFNTITNFNRQFKSLMNVTPSEYISRYAINAIN